MGGTMTHTKHTPAPWSILPDTKKPNEVEIVGERYIAHVYNFANPNPSLYQTENDALQHEHEANAALIAAAPDMLEELHAAKLALYQAWIMATDSGDKVLAEHCSKAQLRLQTFLAA
jgi:hypothetical protein